MAAGGKGRGRTPAAPRTEDITPGYSAYLVKDGDKFVITVPIAEYDPNAPSLTASQIAGIREVADIYERTPAAVPIPAKRIRYDPLRSPQNTSPTHGGHGPTIVVSPPPPPSADDPLG